jgi:hypothetical protein
MLRPALFALRLCALVACLAGHAGPVAAEPAATPASDAWMPLEPGRAWTYDYRRERTQTTAGAAPEIERFRGTLEDRVTGPAAEFGPAALEVISTLRGSTDGDAIQSTEKRRAFVEPHASGYRIHALDTENPILGANQLVRYDPPLEQLRVASGPESSWVIGTIDLGGLSTRLEARVVGVQDADTPSGRYADCLVVRYEGPLRGSIEAYGSTIEVTGGKVAVTEWLARGVGLVLAKEEVEQSLRLPDGSSVVVRERIQYALSASAQPTPASAQPTPAPASR